MRKSKIMRILVIGGAGFQGSHLVKRLVLKGHKVTVLNTWSDRGAANLKSLKRKITTVWGSITDSEIVLKTVRGQDVVFHLAAYVNVDVSLENPLHTLEVNLLGTQNILEAVRRWGNRLIYISSCEVYGDGHTRQDLLLESDEMRPNSPYAASKAAADRLCYAYIRSFGINITIIRPTNVFGERQKPGHGGTLIARLVENAIANKPLVIFGDGLQERDYIYISDLIDAYMMVLKNPELSGQAINFGTGQSTRIIDIARYISKKFGKKVSHGPARPGEVSKFLLDTTRARSFGWKPKVTIWEGLDRYISWAKKNSGNL